MRWDKLGRCGMLAILAVLLYLGISPLIALISTEREAAHQRAQVANLERTNRQLRAERAALHEPSVIEGQARLLGMILPGEQPYVVRGLPQN